MELSNTEKEMLQAKDVCLNFDFSLTEKLAREIGEKKIIFTGMGSSQIFPGKQAKNRALKLNIKNKVETCLASDLFQYTDFSDTYIFLCSNSGKTKEVVLLLEYVKTLGAKCIAVTAVSDSILAQRCDENIVLSCGFEKGVAATKSVVEQALVYDSLIFHLSKNQGRDVDLNKLKEELVDTAEKIEHNVDIKISEELLQSISKAKNYFMVGLDNGVAEEITLKAYEITRKIAIYYADTHIVHGVEEAINEGSVIVFEPNSFEPYVSDFEKFSHKTNCTLVGVGITNLIKGLTIETNSIFSNYCLLAGGWGVLRNIGNSLSLDMDHPEKASKVGNPFEE